MPPRTVGDRGIGDRGLAHRVTTPVPAPPGALPPFDVELLGLLGQETIPTVLAYALRWQIDLDRSASGPLERQQELADKLLTLSDFLTTMESQVERDPRDGALLYRDPIKQFAATRERVVGMTDDGVLITKVLWEPPLPVWAPAAFPPEIGVEERRRYPARPRAVVEIPPFDSADRVLRWMRLRAGQPLPPVRSPGSPTPPAEKAAAMIAVQDPPPPRPVQKQALDRVLDKVAARFDAAPPQPKPHGETPLVTKAIELLSRYTLRDLREATGSKEHSPHEKDPLISHTAFILYLSVFTVVLDRHGNLYDLGGRLAYPLLLPDKPLLKELPPVGGVNVSPQRYGDSQYRIDDDRIVKVLQGIGVGAFVNRGFPGGKHEIQEMLEAFITHWSREPYVASVSADAALHPEEVDLGRIELRLWDLLEATEPHLVTEILARAEKLYTETSWAEVVTSIVEDAIRGVIIGQVRSRLEHYLIKKIGKRIVPLINLLGVIEEVLDAKERIRVRHAVACAILAIKGHGEDLEFAARILAKIGADTFQNEVIAKVTEVAGKAAAAAGKKLVPRPSGAGKATAKPKPKPGPDPGSAPPPPPAGSAAPPAPLSGTGGTPQGSKADLTAKSAPGGPPASLGDDPLHLTPQERKAAEAGARQQWKQTVEQFAKGPAVQDPHKPAKKGSADDPATARHTDNPKTDDPKTDNRGKDARGTRKARSLRPPARVSSPPPLNYKERTFKDLSALPSDTPPKGKPIIRPLPDGVVYEFPGGHRVWREEDGAIRHDTVLGPSLPERKGYERDIHSATERGRPELAGMERAHTLGRGTGFESPFGIFLAPREVNQIIQNNGIEEFFRGLQASAGPGESFHLSTLTIPHPGSERLKEIRYSLSVVKDGQKDFMFEYFIKVGDGPDHKVEHGIADITPDSRVAHYFDLVDVRNRVKARYERLKKK